MELDNAFEVPLPPASAWALLTEVERIAPCLPGAELTEKIDDRTYRGKVGVRLGPVALSFSGTARFAELDAAAHTARVKASGADTKGRGMANATVDFRVEAAGDGSRVVVHTNLALSGAVAQYGRGVGMVRALATQLIGEFASRLSAQLAAAPVTVEPLLPPPVAVSSLAGRHAPPPKAARPISGFTLLLRTLWAMLTRVFSRPSHTS